MRPHVKAVALPVAPAPPHHESDNTNGDGARTDRAPCWPMKFSEDDINVAASTLLPSTLPRRNSAPTTTVAMEQTQEQRSAFSLVLAEHQLMSIDYVLNEPFAPPPPTVDVTMPTPEQRMPLPPRHRREVTCIICCTQLPKENDPEYRKEVLHPCTSCDSTYCISCLKNMFIQACRDSTRMPPRCCVQIHLHHARPFLSKDEVAHFKSKYEEWSTPKPFYCPVPTCSVFIPERLLPEQARSKGKRVDSGIGTPKADVFACPTCEANICAGCRQTAHPNSMCNVDEFGTDAETTALLKSWGYKKCPKCGHGLRRMYGCNHMVSSCLSNWSNHDADNFKECRCGAHFCWMCLESSDDCDGGCDYDDEHEDYQGDEDDDHNEVDEATQRTDPAPVSTDSLSTVEPIPEVATNPTASQPAPPPRNLDAGSHNYWGRQDLFFGDEPTDDIQDRAWSCTHSFSTYKIPLGKVIATNPSALEMECTKCWRPIHPKLEWTFSPGTKARTIMHAPTDLRDRGVRRGRARVPYVTPRGLYRADATVGTAPHLTAPLSRMSQSVPPRDSVPMDDVRFTDRVEDTYGNVVSCRELDPPRHASLDTISIVQHRSGKPASLGIKTVSEVFTATTPRISFAHECRNCSLLVCESCKIVALAAHEEEQVGTPQEQTVEEHTAELHTPVHDAPSEVVAEVHQPVEHEGDDDFFATPSLFD